MSHTAAWVVLMLVMVVHGSSAQGCATSNANKASRSSASTLRYDELQAAANTLANNILSSARFDRAREAARGQGEEIVVALLEPVTIDGDDFTGDLRRKINEFFEVVPEVFLQRDVGEFRRVRTEDGRYLGSEQEGRLDAFDFQDSSSQFDQETGVMSTQGKAKAVIAMEAIGKRDRVPGRSGDSFDFILRVKMYDVVRKVEVYSGSVTLSK